MKNVCKNKFPHLTKDGHTSKLKLTVSCVNFELNKHFLRELLIYFLNLINSEVEELQLFAEAHHEPALSKKSCIENFP